MTTPINQRQLALDFQVARPSLKEKKADGIGLKPESQANVQTAEDGTRYRSTVDAQGRRTVELENQVTVLAPNGLAVTDTPDTTEVNLPNGYTVMHKEGVPPSVTTPDGKMSVATPRYSHKGARTVVGYSFTNQNGHEVNVDIKDMSYSIEDPKRKILQEVTPEGHQFITATHNFRDPETKQYQKDVQKFAVYNDGSVENLSDEKKDGVSDLRIADQGFQFKNRLGAPLRMPLPQPLTHAFQVAQATTAEAPAENSEAQADAPAAESQPPEATPTSAEVAEPPAAAAAAETPGESQAPPILSEAPPPSPQAQPQPVNPQAVNDRLGVIHQDAAGHHPGPAPGPLPGPPGAPPQPATTASGLIRNIGRDGSMSIMLMGNGMAMQKYANGEIVAFDNRTQVKGGVPSQQEKQPIPVQTSLRERPGMPPEEMYQFQDHNGNHYTLFSESGDFLVESRDRRVGTIVYPDGTQRTMVRGNQGVYKAQIAADGQARTTPPMQYSALTPDRFYFPQGSGEPAEVYTPYAAIQKPPQLATGMGMFSPNLPISGELPAAFDDPGVERSGFDAQRQHMPPNQPPQGRRYPSRYYGEGGPQRQQQPQGYAGFGGPSNRPASRYYTQ